MIETKTGVNQNKVIFVIATFKPLIPISISFSLFNKIFSRNLFSQLYNFKILMFSNVSVF